MPLPLRLINRIVKKLLSQIGVILEINTEFLVVLHYFKRLLINTIIKDNIILTILRSEMEEQVILATEFNANLTWCSIVASQEQLCPNRLE